MARTSSRRPRGGRASHLAEINTGTNAPGATSSGGYTPPPGAADETEVEAPPLSNQAQLGADFGADPFAWASWIDATIYGAVTNYAKRTGLDPKAAQLRYGEHANGMMQFLERTVLAASDQAHNHLASINDADPASIPGGRDWYIRTQEGNQALLDAAFGYIGAKLGFDAEKYSPGGGGGGGGRRGPTAAEIREQFDLDQLEDMAQEMHQGLNLSEWDDARSVARSYVDAVVKSGGTQKIDFATFVRSRIEETSRFKSIYANMPENMRPEDYISPYLSVAQQRARPHDAAEIAVGGARFGASAAAFGERLKREETKTAPFISGLESRLEGLNSLFKG